MGLNFSYWKMNCLATYKPLPKETLAGPVAHKNTALISESVDVIIAVGVGVQGIIAIEEEVAESQWQVVRT
jgi:hypothetical protein